MDFDSLIQEGEAVQQGLQAQPAPRPVLPPIQPDAPNPVGWLASKLLPDALLSGAVPDVARRVTTAAAGPEVGAAQLLANGAAAVHVPGASGLASGLNSKIDQVNAQNDEAGKNLPASVRVGSDIAGSVIAPSNLLLASWLRPATTLGSAVIQGGKIGLAQGLTAPVENANQNYWMPKAAQTGISTVVGAIAQPIMNAIGNKVATYVAKYGADPKNASAQADEMLKSALGESGQSLESIPPDQLAQVRASIQGAIANGQKLDAAAALRKSDFDAEGIAPTLGEITRDPQQWAEEQTVKGTLGLGAPLSQTLAAGNKKVMRGIVQYGSNAQEPNEASTALANVLRTYDAAKQADIGGAYATARASAGKDLELPTDNLLAAYRQVANDFGDKVPSAVRAKFEALATTPVEPTPGTAVPGVFKTLDQNAAAQPGPSILNTLESAAAELQPHGYGAPLSPGDYAAALPANYGAGPPKPSFTFEDANKLRGVINAHVGNDTVTNRALGILRSALNNAQTEVQAGGGPFAPATKMAAAHFRELEDIPAISDAVGGHVDDRFIQQQIISNPSTPQVQRLAALLREQAPDVYEQTRQQIGAQLARAAFGENAAGDKQVAQEAYNSALRKIGTGKLNAFFSPDEVAQMQRLGRIASYQVGAPAASAANFSNTASALANLLRASSHFPFAPGSLRLAGDKLAANASLNPAVPVSPNLSDSQRLMLARALTAITGGGAAAATGAVGQQP